MPLAGHSGSYLEGGCHVSEVGDATANEQRPAPAVRAGCYTLKHGLCVPVCMGKGRETGNIMDSGGLASGTCVLYGTGVQSSLSTVQLSTGRLACVK